MASSVVDNTELSAPQGWQKMIVPKKPTTPEKNVVVFVSPTGEEIKTKTQLVKYLKANPGGPSNSEFDWSTGETPRRSRRISEIPKVTESPEKESPKKRQRKSTAKQVVDNEDEAVEEGAAEENVDTVAAEETKPCEEVEMKEAEPVAEKTEDQGTDESGKKEEGVCNENEKADEKTVSSPAHDEKAETEAPSKAVDDSKEEKKVDEHEPQGDNSKEEKKLDEDNSIDKEVPVQQLPGDNYPTGLDEKTVHEPKTSEISC